MVVEHGVLMERKYEDFHWFSVVDEEGWRIVLVEGIFSSGFLYVGGERGRDDGAREGFKSPFFRVFRCLPLVWCCTWHFIGWNWSEGKLENGE